MRHAGFTKQERNFIVLMRVWVVAFLGLAAMFALMPTTLLNYVNDIGKVFFEWQPYRVAAGAGLWRIHSIALHICLAYCCLIAQASSLRNAGYARVLLLGSAVSAVGSVTLLYIDSMQFYYMVAASLDGIVFLVTLWVYSGSSRSRS
jgi:hypothetical protein